MPPLRADEEWARIAIEAATGVPVTQHDDGSKPAMHDLDLQVPGQAPAAVEVSGAVDELAADLWNVANRNGRWIAPDLAGGWFVYVDPYARRRRGTLLHRDLPRFLRELEELGVTEYPAATVEASRLEPSAAQLHVVRARQNRTDYRGSIYVQPELPADQWTGFVQPNGDAIATWVGDFLPDDERADVRRKLAASGAALRHAFVVVAALPGVPFSVTEGLIRNDTAVPTIPPELPNDITHVWIASAWSSGMGFHWDPDIGWTTFSRGGGRVPLRNAPVGVRPGGTPTPDLRQREGACLRRVPAEPHRLETLDRLLGQGAIAPRETERA
jgi:hypothetical protein